MFVIAVICLFAIFCLGMTCGYNEGYKQAKLECDLEPLRDEYENYIEQLKEEFRINSEIKLSGDD